MQGIDCHVKWNIPVPQMNKTLGRTQRKLPGSAWAEDLDQKQVKHPVSQCLLSRYLRSEGKLKAPGDLYT